MLVSRFWYVFLALAAAAATAAALLAQAVINGRADEALTEGLQRDRTLVDTMLRLEARSRLDRIAFISVDGKLGGLLKQAQGVSDEKKLRELNSAVKEALHGHVLRMAEAAGADASSAGQKQRELDPDIAFAVDIDGRIIGQLGPMEANAAGASLATFPLVKRALQGYVRDDVWVYDRRVYRMAARPVMAGTEYAGAIVHGYRLEKGLLEKLSTYLGGATVGFFSRTDLLGSLSPSDNSAAQPQADLAAALAPALASAKWKAGEPTEIMPLAHGGRALFAPVAGGAAAGGVGYVIARPRKLLGSPTELFDQASKDDVNALPWPVLGGGAVLLALIGMLCVYLERDRHMKALVHKTAQISAGQRDRLVITEWRGAYRRLADRINQAIEKEVEKAGERAPASRKKANLDEILGPTPEATGTPFFGFASGDSSADLKPAPKPAAASPARNPAPAPAAPKPAAAPVPAAPAPPVLSARAQPKAPAPPAPAAPPPAAPRSPAPAVSTSIAPNGGDTFDEDAHFREVYDAYVATRKQCGEPIDNLTFEKFGVTLRKTRDQIVEKQGVRLVRFSVQVKEGKAALKAQPFKK